MIRNWYNQMPLPSQDINRKDRNIQKWHQIYHMSRLMSLCHMWTTKTQITLHICAVWSESLLQLSRLTARWGAPLRKSTLFLCNICTCAGFQSGLVSSSLSEASSSSIHCVSEQQRLWRNCANYMLYVRLCDKYHFLIAGSNVISLWLLIRRKSLLNKKRIIVYLHVTLHARTLLACSLNDRKIWWNWRQFLTTFI